MNPLYLKTESLLYAITVAHVSDKFQFCCNVIIGDG